MIHSSFDAIAQFLHRKTEEAKHQTLGMMGPRLGPVVYGVLVVAVLSFALFLIALLADTMLGLGFFTFTQGLGPS